MSYETTKLVGDSDLQKLTLSSTDFMLSGGLQGVDKPKSELLHPNKPLFRLLMLTAICFLTFGSYYCYDIPAATTISLESDYGIKQWEYTLLYSVYSLPNTVLPFFGGTLIDVFLGLRFSGLLFAALVMIGQIIWAAGSALVPNISAYIFAVIGRFVFGLGGESLSVAQSAFSAKWFTGKELALAFGIALSFSRIGSAVNLIISPIINYYMGLQVLLWFGAILCGVSMFFAIVLFILDKIGESYTKDKDVKQDPISFQDIKNFPLSLWLVFFVCVLFYISIFTFITISSALFQYKWGYSEIEGNIFTSFPYFLSAFISPYSGFLVDKLGRAAIWFSTATFGVGVAHTILMLTPSDTLSFLPPIMMVLIGVCYTYSAASLWPSVALLVREKELGTAYGMMTAIQNTGLTISPIVVGVITSTSPPMYDLAELLFAISSFLAFTLSIILIYVDKKKTNGVLTSSPFDDDRRKPKTIIVSEYEDDNEDEYDRLQSHVVN